MKKLLLILISFFTAIAGFSQSFDIESLLRPRTGVQTLVNDYTNTLTADQRQALEAKLLAYNDSTSTQIAVVIVPELGGNDVSDFNVKLGRAWGVGGKEFNNGVVLLISKEDRKLNIATGYGAEGALTDVTSKHIIDDVIVPNFKGNDYYRGIDEGTDAIMRALKGEYKAPANYSAKKKRFPWGSIIFFIIIAVIAIGRGGNSGGGSMMSRRGSGIVNALFWSSMLGGGGRSGGGWSGGGGGSSGGFGGFGGGSFGGGGASGSW